MSPRQKRRRGRPDGARRTRRIALIAISAFFLFGILLPTGAFSLVDASRIGSLGVTGDRNAELGLDVANCVGHNSIDSLVTLTNNLAEPVDVTVSLVDGSDGTLHVGGQSGDSVTFPLAVSDSETVEMEPAGGGPFPRSFDFDIEAAGADTSVTATRGSQIENNCGPSTPTPTATATPDPTNEPPVADFTMSRQGNSAHVNVDGSLSSDPDGDIVSWEWDVGADGNIEATGETARVKADPGEEIRLIVTDDDGATNSTTKTAP